MSERIFTHLKRNLVAYVALFIALGGSSYAAVQLTPGSVSTSALANRSVTHRKLAVNSVTARNIANGSLTRADFRAGTLVGGAKGEGGRSGPNGRRGPAGPQGPAGPAGGAYIGARMQSTGSVRATHGASANVPLSGGDFRQDGKELDLLAGSMTVTTPSTCTGSYGNALVISVDGNPTTFGLAPTIPAGQTVTLPLLVGTLSDPGASTAHHVTAALANSCTKDGEDYTVQNVKLDVLKFN
jgi:hypothetical protein